MCWTAALALSLAGIPAVTRAHEIPARVTVLVLVKPEGPYLRVLVRVPLEAMRDFEWPLRGPGYLDLAGAGPLLRDAGRLWIVDYLDVFAGNEPLPHGDIVGARVSLPSNRAFGNWDDAIAHVRGPPLDAETELPWQQGVLDLLIEYPIASARARFAMRPALAHLGQRTTTVLRFVRPDGGERVLQYAGNPGLVQLDPRWHQAALRFVSLGFQHIMDGFDHLLFILCLVIPFRRMRPLVVIVTSFTVAHSLTLIASATGLAPRALWFPPLIETLIALSIVYMAIENIVGARLQRRWLIAFAFGLVHGFGFSFMLRESLQFAGGHLATALFAFNVGVELGQLLVVIAAVPVLEWLFRRAISERLGTIVLSAIVAHSAWHWMTARWSMLREFEFRWPTFDWALAASLMRGAMLILILVGVVWGLAAAFGYWLRSPQQVGSEE